ncbi:uncharacterized protein TM35_000232170 [Trypanosoma theileri]|uniref:Uncharacterized protein n=1 Tax=Trypanosoma theileri TaxID=67003 RepID=A0A1X0NRA4_9TRYP|nr:uncharacterized protein TM35_000232170 [Trypanosoma theileri]ORC87246.1 hypothetical protein TM35_000232170 [Trypanosoma theileri]
MGFWKFGRKKKNGTQNSTSLPPINGNGQRNGRRHSTGTQSYRSEPNYGDNYRRSTVNYQSQLPPLYANYPNSAQNNGVYMSYDNDYMEYQSNGLQKKDSFMDPQLQRNDSFMDLQLQRNDSFMGYGLQRNDSFMGPPLQRNDSFMGYGLQRDNSFMGSSNRLTRGSSSNGFGLQPCGSFGVDTLNRYDESDDFGGRYVEQSQRRWTQGPPPPPPPVDGRNRQGVASLVRKQSVLHRSDLDRGGGETIGRPGGRLVFKGIEEW